MKGTVTGGDGGPALRRSARLIGRKAGEVSRGVTDPCKSPGDQPCEPRRGGRRDPRDLGLDSPISELAALLAWAALRLHARTALSPDSAPDCPREAESGEISGDSGRNPLDLSAHQSVHGGVVNAPGEARPGGPP